MNYKLFHGSRVKGLTALRPSTRRSFPVIFFSDEPNVAATYAHGGKVYPATVTMNRPMVVDAKGRDWENAGGRNVSTDALSARAYAQGHDGIIIHNVVDEVDEEGYPVPDAPPNNIYAVFSPQQVKLMRRNPLSYENRFELEPMKRYPRSRLVASLSAPPRQRVQVERMVTSPHTFRVVVLEENKTKCADPDARSGEHVEFMRSLAKPGVITLLTDLKNNNVKAEGVLHLYSAFSFVHRLGDFITAYIFPMFGVEPSTHPASVYDIFNERHSDAFIARSAEPRTAAAYYALSRAIGDSGVRALTSNDWQRRPDDPSSGRNIIRRFIVTHTNSDMHRKGKVKPAFWEQSIADWVALSEMPSARARTGRGEPWLLFPPRPGEYEPEVEAVLDAYAEAINTFFPPFAQAALTNLEGSVIDITVCAR